MITDEQRALRETTVEFVRRHVVDHLDQWERDQLVPRSLHQQAAAAGLLGLGFPEEVGGSGGTGSDVVLMQEAFFEAGASSGLGAALFTSGIALPHIAAHGSPEQIENYVRPTLTGEKIGALGITEPGGGSDVAGITTTAVRDGDHYVVNGAKMFITSGVRADFVTTAVSTRERRVSPWTGRWRRWVGGARTPRRCPSPMPGCRWRTSSAKKAMAL